MTQCNTDRHGKDAHDSPQAPSLSVCMYVVSMFVRVRPGPLRKYRALPRKHRQCMNVVSVFVRARPGHLQKYRALPRKHTHNHADDVL